jgi:hypothetical protein
MPWISRNRGIRGFQTFLDRLLLSTEPETTRMSPVGSHAADASERSGAVTL